MLNKHRKKAKEKKVVNISKAFLYIICISINNREA